MSRALDPRILDLLLDGLIRVSCDCEHEAAGHDLERWHHRGEVWYRLGPCLLCPCAGGRDRTTTAPRPLRVVR